MTKIDKTQIIVAIISGLFGMITSITPIVVTSLMQRQPQAVYVEEQYSQREEAREEIMQVSPDRQTTKLRVPTPPEDLTIQTRVYREPNTLDKLLENIWIVLLATLISVVLGSFLLKQKRKGRRR